MWRHEDIFFGALGGGGRWRRADRDARGDRRALPRCRTRCVPACPFMHGTAHWMAFSALFTGGTVVIPTERHLDPVALWALIAREQVNFLVIVGDAFARPLVEALDTDAGAALDLSSLRVLLSGGAILSPAVKQALVETAPGRARRRRLRRVGDRRSGPVGDASPAARSRRAPRFRVNDETAVLDDDLRPVAAPASSGGSPAAGTSRSATTRTRRRPRRRSPSSTACAGRCRATTRVVEDDGTITLLGRGSVSINTGGEKVYPEEVEVGR